MLCAHVWNMAYMPWVLWGPKAFSLEASDLVEIGYIQRGIWEVGGCRGKHMSVYN